MDDVRSLSPCSSASGNLSFLHDMKHILEDFNISLVGNSNSLDLDGHEFRFVRTSLRELLQQSLDLLDDESEHEDSERSFNDNDSSDSDEVCR